MQATLAAVTALALTACAPAIPRTVVEPVDRVPATRLVDIDVLDRNTGDQLPVYWHDGQRWIAGAPGHRYAVSVRNRTARRILTVVSVDGVNAVSGETADWNQRGYVFSPWASFDILGWRKSSAAVADFLFTALENSYAARTGRAADVGVIGVAVFPEARPAPEVLQRPHSQSDSRLRDDAGEPVPQAPAAGASAAPAEAASRAARITQDGPPARQLLGTGHGPSETSEVGMVEFERERDRPDEVITIRYDRYDRLVAMGVIPAPRPMPPAPHAFPGSADAGFVADPPPRY